MLISVFACAAVVTPIADEISASATPHAPHPLGMPDSRSLNLPVLATGQLQDADGDPAAGMVVAYAWPTNMPMSVGDRVSLTPVAWTESGPDGRFTLRASESPALQRLASANGGYLNLSLEAGSADRRQPLNISRYLGGGAQFSRGLAQEAWPESPEAEAVPVVVRFVEDAQGFRATSTGTPFHPCFGEYDVVETKKADTVVGELNTESDTVEARFVYGEGNHADSDISIATKPNGGRWSLAGTHHIANDDETRVFKDAVAMERLRIYSSFDYHLYRDRCPNPSYRVAPHGWRTGLTSVPHLVPDCGGNDHTVFYEPRAGFKRDKNRSATWSGAAEVFGVSLSARSGYSRFVTVGMTFGENRRHAVCGDDDTPNKSSHVYTGIEAPGVPCRPGHPC
ncbi:MAG: hypothetical protein ACRDZ3_20220 [Acidimicrobiia bacterium]